MFVFFFSFHSETASSGDNGHLYGRGKTIRAPSMSIKTDDERHGLPNWHSTGQARWQSIRAQAKKKKEGRQATKWRSNFCFILFLGSGTKVQNYRKRHWHRQLRVRKKKSNNKWKKKWVVIRWSSTRVRWRFHSSPNEGDSNENHGICGRNS